MKYSVIIPVYNRPDEVGELLESLCKQAFSDFEVIVVEDGSSITCRHVAERYATRLQIQYLSKENGGPGQARNYGATHARGHYYIVLDSDVVLPEGYLQAIDTELQANPCDAFGGPDSAHPDFTPLQKAISYSMTSFFTTGGIRGGKRKMDKFYPRSFNMGMKAELWHALGGFSKMRFGEDIDLSIRIFRSGSSCRLFPEAWVWHKRRATLRQFFKQVHNSGIARINLYKKYPDSLKLVHTLPALFTVGVVLLSLLFLTGLVFLGVGLAAGYCNAIGCNMGLVVAYLGTALMALALAPLLLYSLLLFVGALLEYRNIHVAFLSIPAAFCQLIGYGTGFIRAWWKRCICGRDEFTAFKDNFYK
ncbi:MAG: glycosyltransferase [Bacteroidaceae bacterium]|nr:glycosyltransferase [Bacteroidaceae bacterium]